MNPTQLDQLRDALRRETEQLEPVGLGVETVRRRGTRRRNRGRALVAVATVTCLAGVGVSLAHRAAGRHSVSVTNPSTSPTPALDFRVVAGAVSYATHFTGSDGVTYALSTAPGSTGTPAQPGQAIYSTTDGEHWTTADQGTPWISALTEGGGMLYAIGTAPGPGGSDVTYRVGTSNDGGRNWADANLPFDQTAPSATVSLSRSASVKIARNATTTVAMLTEQFFPNLNALIAARAPGHEKATTQTTDAGYDIIDLSACARAKPAAAGVSTTIPSDPANVTPSGATCDNPPVLGTIAWSDLGLRSGADLTRQQMLVSTDGTHWDHVTAPATGFVQDLVAGTDGFLLLANTDKSFGGSVPGTETQLLRSTDARTWTTVTTPADLNVQAIAGDRIIGVDSAGAVVQTSSDGGTTWTARNLPARAQLPSGAPAATATMADAGPLGFAVVVMAGSDPKDHIYGDDVLLFSTDGISWSTSDLLAAGAPSGAYPLQVMVGADHIGVDYEDQSAAPGPVKITTLLATPKR